jgi:hypothetical protein
MDDPESHSAATSTSSDSSSNLEASRSTGDRLQVLAAAVAATWRGMPSIGYGMIKISQFTQQYGQFARQFYVVARLLVLLVQQLQATPPQQRAAFLHSPYGNNVLRVLSEMSTYEATERCVLEVLMESGSQVAATGQQGKPAAPAWVNHWPQGRPMVQLLLLPALLLGPSAETVAFGSDGAERASSSNPGNCSSSTSSTSGANSGSGDMLPGAPGAPTSATNRHLVLSLEGGWHLQAHSCIAALQGGKHVALDHNSSPGCR